MNFYIMLKENLNNIDYLKENIDSFNELSDNEIKILFEDVDINFDIKEFIATFCYKRINKLPFNVFIYVLFYVGNSKILISNYGDRINNMSYLELTSLIYDCNLNYDCLIEITEMSVFKKYLLQEKQTGTLNMLQCCEILKEIYLINDDIEKLQIIGQKINDLLSLSKYSKDIEIVINNYLDAVINNNQRISLESNINNIGISMMNYYIKNHKCLSNKLVKFYILFRLKDLNLESFCSNVYVTEQDSSFYGYFQQSSKMLKIYNNYLKNKFDPFFKEYNITDENWTNDFLNLMNFSMISHELGHVVMDKGYNNLIENVSQEQFIQNLKENKGLYYWYKNGILRLTCDEKVYLKKHDQFIEENRADLFAIFDSNIQINEHFKSSFSEILVQNICKSNAEKIIRLYTQKIDGTIKVVTPMQKFDEFFKSILPNEEMLSISKDININSSPNEIMNNLVLGDVIPLYVLEEILKIAKGQTITDNLYKSVIDIINNYKVEQKKNNI